MSSGGSNTSLNSCVAAFRRFNRMYTRFIGVLDEEFLNSGYSLAEGRVLYELAAGQSSTAKEIAVALGIDPAYVSRILGRFEKNSLLKRVPSKKDARSAYLALTQKGKSRFEKLNGLSEEQARCILKALPPTAQTKLIGSMGTVERLLAPSILAAARHIYQKAGFRLVEEKANRQFGKDLLSQTWELDLTESGVGRVAGRDGRTGPNPS